MSAASAVTRPQNRSHTGGNRVRTGSRETTSGKVDHGESLQPGSFLQQMERCLYVLCVRIELFFVHDARLANLTRHGTLVTDGLDDVASARLTLCPDECSALGDAPQCLA